MQNVRYSVAVGGKADVNRTSRNGAFAEFERSMIRQRIRAGLRRAVEAGKQLGRPKIDPALEKRMQSQGQWCRTIAHACTQ
jgi:2-keto-3-deoxy-L-rhamnonate aldolase RhmA